MGRVPQQVSVRAGMTTSPPCAQATNSLPRQSSSSGRREWDQPAAPEGWPLGPGLLSIWTSQHRACPPGGRPRTRGPGDPGCTGLREKMRSGQRGPSLLGRVDSLAAGAPQGAMNGRQMPTTSFPCGPWREGALCMLILCRAAINVLVPVRGLRAAGS